MNISGLFKDKLNSCKVQSGAAGKLRSATRRGVDYKCVKGFEQRTLDFICTGNRKPLSEILWRV